ncbi:5-oxoprolinase subunit PxpA [Aestuariivivens sediminicola]|uniref:5-oxoprolinase subunit PxpA n=1 Tax=Aestuariivivens sediminicola TaxID=2913560 RepID=UPI001F5A080D|nr:5-oxoprolinase subunit PxpA [Aestuariivivens sediminicola]
MNSFIIDINADVGEGIGNEASLMPLISSCNIACGGHAGDDSTMETVIGLAKSHGVKIGAHPSFPDKINFGRSVMDMSDVALYETLEEQVCRLIHHLDNANVSLHHVKPHGALYNLAAKDKNIAMVIVELLKRFAFPVYLYVPFKSVIADMAVKHHIPITYEAFADRNYNDDLSLVSRNEPNALIEDPGVMYDHLLRMIKEKKVRTVSGKEVSIEAHTFCVHGDNPKALRLLEGLRDRLMEKKVQIL